MIVRHSLYGPELNAQIVHEYLSTAHKRNFTANFKLNVQTHEDSLAKALLQRTVLLVTSY